MLDNAGNSPEAGASTETGWNDYLRSGKVRKRLKHRKTQEAGMRIP